MRTTKILKWCIWFVFFFVLALWGIRFYNQEEKHKNLIEQKFLSDEITIEEYEDWHERQLEQREWPY